MSLLPDAPQDPLVVLNGDLVTAEAMLRLRAIYLSGDFDEHWDFHVQQDQHRLYGHAPWTVAAK